MPDQVKQHLSKLLTYLESDELTAEGRRFVIGEVRELTVGGGEKLDATS